MKRLMWLAVMLLSFGFIGCGGEEVEKGDGDPDALMNPDDAMMDPGATLPEGGPDGDAAAPKAP